MKKKKLVVLSLEVVVSEDDVRNAIETLNEDTTVGIYGLGVGQRKITKAELKEVYSQVPPEVLERYLAQ